MKDKQKIIQAYTLVFQLGFSVIVPVLLCIFLAIKLETLELPLIVAGILAGIRNAWILVKQAIK